MHRPDRGRRNSAGGEINAFYRGYREIVDSDWDIIGKLDGDLSFEEDYFEKCMASFAENPRLNIEGGNIFNVILVKPVPEPHPRFHVRGAVKLYRRACWEQIGRLTPSPGWDTLDEVKAQFHGWDTYTFSDVPVMHHRVTGDRCSGWRAEKRNQGWCL